MKLSDAYSKIDQKKCVLCGNLEAIDRFITGFQNRLDISAVVTNDYDEIDHQTFLEKYGIESVLFTAENCEDDLVIICSNFARNSTYLKQIGLKEYSDFIIAELVDAWLNDKGIILMMGTQLLFQIGEFLKLSEDIRDAYSIVFFADETVRSNSAIEPEDKYEDYLHVGRCADIYIHSSTEKEGHRDKLLKSDQLKENCRIISISDYGFRGYFPQIRGNRNDYSKYFFSGLERLDMNYLVLAGAKTDYVIEKHLLNKMSEDEIFNIVRDHSKCEFPDVPENVQNELVRIHNSEHEDDIKIADFIEANLNLGLCRNLEEWNEPMLSYITDALLRILGLNPLTVEKTKLRELVETSSGCETYIYPDVQLKLDLAPKKSYKVVTFYNTYIMSGDEYLKYIIHQMNLAMKMIELTGFIPTNR